MSLGTTLLKRSNSKCELCLSSTDLSAYSVPPVAEVSADKSVMICKVCLDQVEGIKPQDTNHWRCLNESMWSEYSVVQVMAWRMLKKLSGEDWARDLLDQLFLDEEIQNWAQVGMVEESHSSDNVKPTKDSNGTILVDGDSVTLIKDLDVKGANFTAKRGTLVKNISLTINPEHIEGRVNGTQIVLLTCFLKKAI